MFHTKSTCCLTVKELLISSICSFLPNAKIWSIRIKLSFDCERDLLKFFSPFTHVTFPLILPQSKKKNRFLSCGRGKFEF
eukprot:UN20024